MAGPPLITGVVWPPFLAQAVPPDTGGLEFVWAFEGPLAWLSVALAAIGLWRFFPFGRNRALTYEANPGLGIARLTILLSGLWFWWVLATAADGQILGFYTLLYAALAYACLLWFTFWRPILGVYIQGDIVERGNLAAALVLAGFAIGTAFAFGGALSGGDTSCAPPRLASPYCQAIVEAAGPGFPAGSVGSGGWHVVLVFFLLAYFELRASVTMVDRIGGGLSRQVRTDRDTSAGILLACVAISCGLVAGRAAAGDYEGWGPALRDYFHRLWPIILIPFAACAAGFFTTDKPHKALVRNLTGLALVGFGLVWYVVT